MVYYLNFASFFFIFVVVAGKNDGDPTCSIKEPGAVKVQKNFITLMDNLHYNYKF